MAATTTTASSMFHDIEAAALQVETLAEILHDLVELYGLAKVPSKQVGAIAFALEHECRRINQSATQCRSALR